MSVEIAQSPSHDDLGTIAERAEGFDPRLVSEVARRVVQNQYKRVVPPIAKLSRRTINHDFRYLRDWRR